MRITHRRRLTALREPVLGTHPGSSGEAARMTVPYQEETMKLEAEPVNGDMAVRAVMNTLEMDWTPSPTGAVLRKRLHLVGGAESGQVTSLVRYLPGSTFHEHDHPEGEEIFVIKGTFSDHLGDADEGNHLLNPEGFRHAPHSKPGCLILVKLRQYGGPGRKFRRTQTFDMTWAPTDLRGIEQKSLCEEDRFPDVTRLERWAPGARPGPREFPGGAEFYVIEGAFDDAEGHYPGGTWLRLPAGSTLEARSSNGCVAYVKTGALPTLRST
jgi:anti-sigma factor ChrR (cupin superfamily)